MDDFSPIPPLKIHDMGPFNFIVPEVLGGTSSAQGYARLGEKAQSLPGSAANSPSWEQSEVLSSKALGQ